jgi:hypothetical protein
MTDTVTSKNIDLSSWDILYKLPDISCIDLQSYA